MTGTLAKLCKTALFPFVSRLTAERIAEDEGKRVVLCAHCGKYHIK